MQCRVEQAYLSHPRSPSRSRSRLPRINLPDVSQVRSRRVNSVTGHFVSLLFDPPPCLLSPPNPTHPSPTPMPRPPQARAKSGPSDQGPSLVVHHDPPPPLLLQDVGCRSPAQHVDWDRKARSRGRESQSGKNQMHHVGCKGGGVLFVTFLLSIQFQTGQKGG